MYMRSFDGLCKLIISEKMAAENRHLFDKKIFFSREDFKSLFRLFPFPSYYTLSHSIRMSGHLFHIVSMKIVPKRTVGAIDHFVNKQ